MKKKQFENQSQSGRSMVEMLGVLAVIGVISIGGIAGYRMAMNRYQANQIANEINLMRTDAKMKAAMKTAQGAENLMLGEPYDSGHLNLNSHYGVEFDFAVFSEAGEPEESGYYIKVSGVPAGVCKPLVTLLEGMDDAIAVVVNNDAENNADSSADLCTEESNEIEVDFSTKDIGGVSGGSGNPEEPEPEYTDPEQADQPQDAPVCNEDTCPGGTCNEEGVCECPEADEHWTGTDCITCPAGTTWSETERDCVCSDGKYLYGNQCVTCDSSSGGTWDSTSKRCKCDNGIWDMEEGKCVDNSCGTGETTCDEKQYCDTSSASWCINGKNTNASKGTCKDIDVSNVEEKTINGKTYYLGTYVDWWTAQRYCQALAANGKGHGLMVSLEELGCPAGTTGSGACADGALRKALYGTCKKGEDCCTEDMLCCDKDSDCTTFDSHYVWTSTTQGSNSCDAYDVNLDSGNVHYDSRNDGYYALCE